jgi:ubiquinone/menaquinone biosynthesis C-methylase UbiE
MTPRPSARHGKGPSPMGAAVLFHEDVSRQWEQKYAKPQFKARLKVLESFLRGKDRPAPRRDGGGAKWLDAGCGTGALSRVLAENRIMVTAVDRSPAMVKTARSLTSSALRNAIRYETVGSIERLSMAGSSFDGVLCSSVIEYLDRPEDCLKEFHRVLRPGGELVLSVPNRSSIFRLVQQILFRLTSLFGRPYPAYLRYVKNRYSRGQFEALLNEHGFRTLEVQTLGSGLPPFLDRSVLFGTLFFFHARKTAQSRQSTVDRNDG